MKLKKLSALMFAVYGASAYALDPAAIPVGEASLIPTLGVSMVSDNNIRASDTKTSSIVKNLNPNLLLVADTRNATYQLNWGVNHQIFDRADQDSLTNHNVTASAGFEFDARNALDVSASHARTESIANLLNDNNDLERFANNNLNATYAFGASGALFNLELGMGYNQLRTLDSNVNKDLERNTLSLDASWLTRISSRTQIDVTYRNSDVSYVDDVARAKNSTNQSLLAGVRWEATGITSGRAKFGAQQRSFNNDGRSDATKSTAEIAVDWSPLRYSTITLSADQQFEEGSQSFDYVQATRVSLSWNHSWSDRVSTNASAGQYQQRYIDSQIGESDRTEHINNMGVSVNYSMRRWLDLTAGYDYSERTSKLDSRDFTRNQFRVGVSMSL